MGWEYRNNALQKTYVLGEFADAMEFVNRVAMIAETKHHHPDILIQYGKVTISTTTHDDGGVTDKDFDLIKTIEQLALEAI